MVQQGLCYKLEVQSIQPMTVPEVLSQLEAKGDASVRKHNAKWGAGSNQYGVKMGDIRAIAKKIKSDHELGLALWQTGNIDARFAAILIMEPKTLSVREVEDMVKSIDFAAVADWFASYVLKEYPDKDQFRDKWMNSKNRWLARLGWGLMAGKITRDAEGLDIGKILDRIETEMPGAPNEIQWTMNTALAQVGINHAQYRQRALEIGERLGVYRDYPVSKGCTSPFAPIWINEMVRRQEKGQG